MVDEFGDGGAGSHETSGSDGRERSEWLLSREASVSSMYTKDWSSARSNELSGESCAFKGSKFRLRALAKAASLSNCS